MNQKTKSVAGEVNESYAHFFLLVEVVFMFNNIKIEFLDYDAFMVNGK